MPFHPDIPSIRKLILPNEGCALVDLDLERADAHFVAWEADEPELKEIFAKNIDIYTEEAHWVYNTAANIKEQRQRLKSAVHGTNYGAKPRTVASVLGTTTARAAEWQDKRWFGRFPGIKKWHSRTEQQIKLTNEVRNIFGYRRLYFDRNEHILPQALAWICQSGVAEVINIAMKQIRKSQELRSLLYILGGAPNKRFHPVNLQVHDSLLLNIPTAACPQCFPLLLKLMEVEVPYPQPMTIPASLKWSDKSWGDCKEWPQ